MNTFWIRDGKKFTIIGTTMIALCAFLILRTENTLESTFLGMVVLIFGIVTVKSALGWSYVRRCEKLRKQRDFQFQ